MQADWELSQSFESDGQGVRVACVLPPVSTAATTTTTTAAADDSTTADAAPVAGIVNDAYRIVAGTQGGNLWEYGVPSGNLVPIPYQHNHDVTAIKACLNKDCYVTGCKDSIIRVFSIDDHTLLYTLEGHEKAVTSLDVVCVGGGVGGGQSCFLISGSWDGTAKVWNLDNRSLVTTLGGHENTVSVCALDKHQTNTGNGTDTDIGSSMVLRIATGSAGIAQNNVISNHSIRIWTVTPSKGEAKLERTVSNDHEGPIRDVCCVTSSEGRAMMLASCSNDGTVKLRSTDTGDVLVTLATAIATASGESPMLLSLTASSSSSSCTTPLCNYLASSAEDGHVFVWSSAGSGDAVAAANDSASLVPQVIRHASCVWSVTTVPSNGDLITCSQDGKLRIFTQAADRMAPLEERTAFTNDVQEAVKSKQSGGGPSPEEIAKLPRWEMNALQQGKSEGQVQVFQKDGIAIAAQWSAASRTWIEVGQVMGSNSEQSGTIDGVQYDHVLPIEVDTQGGGVAKLSIGYNTGENPFVAAQRFIDAHMLPQYHLAEIADYIQKRVGEQAPTLGMDTSAAMPAKATAVAYKHLPVRAYKSFELGKKAALEKMQAKLVETGKLNDGQVQALASLVQTLAATNRYHATKISREELLVVRDMLKWPSPAEAFAALDLARLVVLHPDAASRDKNEYWNEVLQLACRQCDQVTDADGTAAVAIPMLSLRLFSNCFRGGPGSLEGVGANLVSVVDCAENYVLSGNKNIRLSVATLLMNVACYEHAAPDAPEVSHQVVTMVDALLASKLYESEATLRALLALGTIALAKEDARQAAKTLYLTTKVEPAASPHGDKAKAVAKEIYTILS